MVEESFGIKAFIDQVSKHVRLLLDSTACDDTILCSHILTHTGLFCLYQTAVPAVTETRTCCMQMFAHSINFYISNIHVLSLSVSVVCTVRCGSQTSPSLSFGWSSGLCSAAACRCCIAPKQEKHDKKANIAASRNNQCPAWLWSVRWTPNLVFLWPLCVLISLTEAALLLYHSCILWIFYFCLLCCDTPSLPTCGDWHFTAIGNLEWECGLHVQWH